MLKSSALTSVSVFSMLATATIATAAEEEVEILFGPPHFIDYLVPVESIDPKVVTPRMDTLSPFDEESGHGPLILEGMKTASGPNFAGSYLYLQMPACGTGMTCAVIVNLRDGAIIEVPAGDTGHDFRAQSNLFVTATRLTFPPTSPSDTLGTLS